MFACEYSSLHDHGADGWTLISSHVHLWPACVVPIVDPKISVAEKVMNSRARIYIIYFQIKKSE